MKEHKTPMQPLESEIEQEIVRAIRKIRYGAVEIVIHDSRIVQLEVREKFRLEENTREGKESTEGKRRLS